MSKNESINIYYQKFYLKKEFFDKLDYRCWIRVNSVIPGYVTRDDLIYNADTSTITMIRAPIGIIL